MHASVYHRVSPDTPDIPGINNWTYTLYTTPLFKSVTFRQFRHQLPSFAVFCRKFASKCHFAGIANAAMKHGSKSPQPS
jgi:hypothetical protein